MWDIAWADFLILMGSGILATLLIVATTEWDRRNRMRKLRQWRQRKNGHGTIKPG